MTSSIPTPVHPLLRRPSISWQPLSSMYQRHVPGTKPAATMSQKFPSAKLLLPSHTVVSIYKRLKSVASSGTSQFLCTLNKSVAHNKSGSKTDLQEHCFSIFIYFPPMRTREPGRKLLVGVYVYENVHFNTPFRKNPKTKMKNVKKTFRGNDDENESFAG
jgi:hypothetical protein